ncbi:MAG TPA: hypothetical protein GXZ49_03380 [Bacteroidetes bacterium]|nr:hypothetical protein [Bacteroidota bacterium]
MAEKRHKKTPGLQGIWGFPNGSGGVSGVLDFFKSFAALSGILQTFEAIRRVLRVFKGFRGGFKCIYYGKKLRKFFRIACIQTRKSAVLTEAEQNDSFAVNFRLSLSQAR